MKNLLTFVLLVTAVVAVPSAVYYRHESRRTTRMAEEIKAECQEMRKNSQVERERQYQMALDLTRENDELKQRLKYCAK